MSDHTIVIILVMKLFFVQFGVFLPPLLNIFCFNTQIHSIRVFLAPYLICCCCCVASVVSDSVRPHRRQPTRFPGPWDSPGKSTEVGCHFHSQCMKVKSKSKVTQSCPTLSDPMDCSPPGSSTHGIFQARVLEWGAITFSRGFQVALVVNNRLPMQET